jgi:hypothetical protein
MFTVIETPLFAKLWPDYWTEDERTDFAAFLAANPEEGDVIRQSGGAARCAGRAQAQASAAACA